MMKRHRASFTAASVARSASMGAKFLHPNVLPATYVNTMLDIQRAAGIVTPFHEYVASSSPYRSIMNVVDKRVAHGISSHMTLRKRYIYDQTKTAIAKGIGSVVNIGAGFDALCWHLASQHQDVMFYEIDHPLTAHDKEAAIKQLGPQHKNFQTIPVDLSRVPLKKILPDNVTAQPTLFIAEGLLMYLPSKAVNALFQDISANCQSGTHFVFTHLPIDISGRPSIGKPRMAAVSRWILSRLGEPILWGCHPEKLGSLLHSVGMELSDQPTFSEISKLYLSKELESDTDTLEWFVTGIKT
jgi:methyltransferase (TIGR00027 family)